MNKEYRGGNSRQLAKSLDQLESAAAVLDRKGQILFANAALCRLADAEATQLAGKQTSWDLPADATAHAAILTAFAPPSAARAGQITVRRLTTPIVFGSQATGQLFVPIVGEDDLVQLFLVVLGDWQQLSQQARSGPRSDEAPEFEATLTKLRSKYSRLDGLHALMGESSAMELAMARAQLAITSNANFIVYGPKFVGKGEVSRGIFAGRLKRLGLAPTAGHYFPVDCATLDVELLDGMLAVFMDRFNPDLPLASQQLVLENFEHLTDAALDLILNYRSGPLQSCGLAAISQLDPQELAARAPRWKRMVHALSVHEIEIPGLSQRREDIAPHAHQRLAQCCKKAKRALLDIAPEALDLLQAFSWPRNLRQLYEAIDSATERAVLTKALQPNHLPVEIRAYPGSLQEANHSAHFEPIHLDEVLLELERMIIRRAMRLSPRNRAQVARWLNISRPRLLRRIEQLGLDENNPDT